MKEVRKVQMSETIELGLLLALVGGFLDAYTYLLRDGVFANAQTGNIVLFGIHLAEGEFSKAALYLPPILAFVAGVFVSDFIRKKYQGKENIHWRQICILLELIALGIVGIIPQGPWNEMVNITVSFVCSVQVSSFRKFHGFPYASTMCTGNLRSGTDCLFRYLEAKDMMERKKAIFYYVIIMVFITGGAIGTVSAKFLGIYAIWICVVLLAIVFVMMFWEEKRCLI